MATERAIVPSAELGGDRHQIGLWRLAAVGQYLYDTMAGGTSMADGPLPMLAMEKVREAQQAIDDAIKHGQRTRRSSLGGELELVERWEPSGVRGGDQ